MTFDDPIKDTRKSIKLIGKVLNKEQQANQYINLYNQHLNYILKIKNNGTKYIEQFLLKGSSWI